MMHKLGNLHHIGLAVKDISSATLKVTGYFNVVNIGPTIYDPLQKAHLCLITLGDGTLLELVSGEIVQEFLKETRQLYHHCYEVEDIHASVNYLQDSGAKVLAYPKAAKLFNNRQVAFLSTEFGIVELLEKEEIALEAIYIVGNQTLEPFTQSIKAYAREIKFPITIDIAVYNQLLIECMNSMSALRNHSGTVIMLFGLEDISRYTKNNTALSEYVKEFILALNQAEFKAKKIFLFVMPYPKDDKQYNIYESMLTEMKKPRNMEVIFLNQLHHFDFKSIFNKKTNEIAHIPYNSFFYDWLSDYVLRLVHYRLRRSYKLVVVDCDNTLWAGVCAEASMNTLKITDSHKAFQEKLIDLSKKGMIIALVSKNNPEDVWRVFNHHPDMLLEKKYIIAEKINWEEKSKNIRELCEQYNVATDSVIFIDDNPSEIALVNYALPEVLSILFSEYLAKSIVKAWQFDKFSSTKEDDLRIEFYKTEIQRKEIERNSKSFEEFIDSLCLTVKYKPITPIANSRIEQMLSRITQFNTSCLSMDDKLIEIFSPSISYILSVSDRFGEYGESGLLLMNIVESSLIIEAILLSCRVLNRGVEENIVEKITEIAKQNNLSEIHIKYKESSRNKPAKQFIEQCGLFRLCLRDSGVEYVFSIGALNYKRVKIIPTEERNINPDQVKLNQIVLNVINQPSKPAMVINHHDINSIFLKKINELCKSNVIKLTDNFIALGGDSIKATYLVSWLYEKYNLEISILDVLTAKTLEEILRKVKAIEGSSISQLKLDIVPALPVQKWLYHIDQLKNGSWFYNMPFIFHIHGKLNRESLIKSLQSIVTKHVAFHTKFFEKEGEIFMMKIPPHLLLIEVSATGFSDDMIISLFNAEMNNKFNLNSGPLIRFVLIQRGQLEFFLITNKHHIISDGWSDQILFKDIHDAYINNGELPEPSSQIDFYDYCHWIESNATKNDCANFENYVAYIGAIEGLKLPFLKPVESVYNHYGIYKEINFTQEMSQLIIQTAQRLNTTPYVIFLTIYHRALQDITHQEQHHILTPISGRSRPECLDLIGCFVNLLVVNLNTSLGEPIDNVVDAVSTAFEKALSFSSISFPQIFQALPYRKSAAADGAFQAMLAMQNMNIGCLALPELEINYFRRGYPAARIALILELEFYNNTFVGGFYYNTELLSTEFIDACQTKMKMSGHSPK